MQTEAYTHTKITHIGLQLNFSTTTLLKMLTEQTLNSTSKSRDSNS